MTANLHWPLVLCACLIPLCAAAGTEEEIECVSKHTKDATILRASYRFKLAEIKTIMRLGGYSDGIAGADFKWEHHLIQGRQLITPEIMQAEWPAEWAQSQQAVFPGLDRLLQKVNAKGATELTPTRETATVRPTWTRLCVACFWCTVPSTTTSSVTALAGKHSASSAMPRQPGCGGIMTTLPLGCSNFSMMQRGLINASQTPEAAGLCLIRP